MSATHCPNFLASNVLLFLMVQNKNYPCSISSKDCPKFQFIESIAMSPCRNITSFSIRAPKFIEPEVMKKGKQILLVGHFHLYHLLPGPYILVKGKKAQDSG